MILYILHVTVITTICFLFYKLLLQRETFYHLNRWILMGCLAVSFALPLLPVPREFSWRDKWEEQTAQDRPVAQANTPDTRVLPKTTDDQSSAVNAIPTDEFVTIAGHKTAHSRMGRVSHNGKSESRKPGSIQSQETVAISAVSAALLQDAGPAHGRTIADAGKTMPARRAGDKLEEKAGAPASLLFLVIQWVFYCYLFGLLLFGGSFLLQIAVLLYQSYSRPVIRDGRFRIVEIRGNRAPCSFGNTIFINPENYDWETYNQILIHEKVHVSGRHTLDILLAEIAVVLQWFNPFVWLYRREVENNLEFLTDASVLSHREVERSAYQLSLLRVSAPHLPFSITNNYNQSLLKRRIVMMNSKRSSVHTVWKYFFLLPILTVLVCALNKPAVFAATEKSAQSDRSETKANPHGGPVVQAGIMKSPALHSQILSGFSDTTVRPVTGSASGNEGANSRDSSGDHRYYNDEDYEMLKAYSASQKALDIDQLNFQLATTKQTAVQLHLNEQQLMAMKDQMKMAGQNLNLKYEFQPALKMKWDLQTNLDPSIGLSHLDMIADTGLREGAWFATSSDEKLNIELRSGDDGHNWTNDFSVDKKEINPFPGQGSVEFKLVREAGTIAFKGQFDGQEGFGHFKFTPDEGYMAALKQMGVEDLDDRREFAFFTLNIKKDYVDMLIHNGYPHISQRDLISFAAMKIDKDFIDGWHGSGFDDADNPRNLISLKAMKIDRAYVDELKAAGYDHLNIHELMSMKAQHIDRAYIRSLGRNGDSPIPVRELISYKAMHIDSGYLEGLRKVGYSNLPRNEVTSLYAMHVTPEYIKGLQDAGYKDIPVRDLASMKALDITPDYIKGFRDVGYTDLPLRELSIYKSMHITPEYIRGFNDIGYKDLEPRHLTSFKSMGITPEFIKGFKDLGYTDLSANELGMLKSMNITPDFVKGFNKIGFDHISVHLLTMLKASGIDADYVSKMKAKGFNSTDLTRYIRLKNDFN